MNDNTRLGKTKAGLQGILITEQRTQKRLGAIKSNIPLAKTNRRDNVRETETKRTNII